MNFRFVFFVAIRYFKAKRREKKIASSILSASGICMGVMTLVVVIAVMNGFQLSFIEPILEIKSYHIQVERNNADSLTADQVDAIRAMDGVRSIVPFVEIQAIAGLRRPCLVRGIPLDTVELDQGFSASFSTEFDLPGKSRLAEENSVLLGSQLAAQLHLRPGDTLSLFTFSGASFDRLAPQQKNLQVTGLFKTGFYEIDLNWAFVSMATADGFGAALAPVYGIKLDNRNDEENVIRRIKDLLREADSLEHTRVESWRDFNRVFFGALLTEKMMMMFLIGLIFIVVAFNIFHSLRKSVYERVEEIATLKAMGASVRTVQNIFISEGFMIGLVGGILGMTLGLLIAGNINSVFRLIEKIANTALLPAVEIVLTPLAGSPRLAPISLFSPTVFYIDEVPIRILLHEVFAIIFFAILCSAYAAFFASKHITSINPSSVLRFE